MTLEEKLKKDIVDSMKAKNAIRVETLRMVKAAVTNMQITKGSDVLDDKEVISIFQKQVKQRNESIENYKKAGRTELAEKEENEIKILEEYLEEDNSIEKQSLQDILIESIPNEIFMAYKKYSEYGY